jgi:hypothetical protein
MYQNFSRFCMFRCLAMINPEGAGAGVGIGGNDTKRSSSGYRFATVLVGVTCLIVEVGDAPFVVAFGVISSVEP